MVEYLGTKGDTLEYIYDSRKMQLSRVYSNDKVYNDIQELIPRWCKMFKQGVTMITNQVYIVVLDNIMGVLVSNKLYKIAIRSGRSASNYVSRPYIEKGYVKCIHSFLLYDMYFVKVVEITPEQARRMCLLDKALLKKLLSSEEITDNPVKSIKIGG